MTASHRPEPVVNNAEQPLANNREWLKLQVTCEVCGGRGWLKRQNAFPAFCHFCSGKSKLSWRDIARKLDEDPDTLTRMFQGRSRKKTCLRVLDKVSKLLWPRGQTEMFQ